MSESQRPRAPSPKLEDHAARVEVALNEERQAIDLMFSFVDEREPAKRAEILIRLMNEDEAEQFAYGILDRVAELIELKQQTRKD